MAAPSASGQNVGRRIIKLGKDILIPNIYEFHIKNLFNSSVQDEWSTIDKSKIELDQRKISDEFRTSLKRIEAICHASDVTPVFMTQANRISLRDSLFTANFTGSSRGISAAKYVEAYSAFNEVIRQSFRNSGSLFVDLDHDVPSSGKYIYDACHLNGEGCQLVGEIVAATIAQHRRVSGNW